MQQWFQEDQYVHSDPPPVSLEAYAGDNGVATVAVYANGKSQPGWGEKDFARNYKLGKFNAIERTETFAYVMRSLPMLVVDIDGKNDGIDHAKLLNLPPTMAETSKSGMRSSSQSEEPPLVKVRPGTWVARGSSAQMSGEP